MDAQHDERLDGQLRDQLGGKLDQQVDGNPKESAKDPESMSPGEGNAPSGGSIAAKKNDSDAKKAPGAQSLKKGGRRGKESGFKSPKIEPLPVVDAGSSNLSREPIRASDAGDSFQAVEQPIFRSPQRQSPKAEPPIPEKDKALSLFREAIALASRLHANLRADARDLVTKIQTNAGRLASRGQSDLDAGIDKLATALTRSRSALDDSTASTLAYLDQRNRQTKVQIRQAAQAAFGALGGAKKKADSEFEKHDKERTGLGETTSTKRQEVVESGTKAATALNGLEKTKEEKFPTSGDSMTAATNEAVQLGLPDWVPPPAKDFTEESKAHDTKLKAIFDKMANDLSVAFDGIKKNMASIASSNIEAIAKARNASFDQLEKTTLQLEESIAEARARGHAALIRQYNQSRRQLIETHRERAKGEVSAAQGRATRSESAATGAASAQQAAARSLSENLMREQARPPQDFAKVISTSSSAFLKNGAKTVQEQRVRIATSAEVAEQNGQRQAESTGLRLEKTAEQYASQIEATGQSTGVSLREQIENATDAFIEMPRSVTSALKSALPSAIKSYKAQTDDAAKKVLAGNTSVTNTLAGTNSDPGADAKVNPEGSVTAAGGETSKGPRETPNAFKGRAFGIEHEPKSEPDIVELGQISGKEVPKVIRDKAASLYQSLRATSTNVESVMALLRKLTALQGKALRDFFSTEYDGRDLESMLRSELRKFFSAGSTDDLNVEAAVNYLNGNQVEAARAELKAAVNYTNDEGRVERVKRALSPANLAILNERHPGDMKEVREDLSESEAQVSNALDRVKPLEKLKGDALDKQKKANLEALGEANAIGLQKVIDQARDKKGEAGGDEVVDKVSEFRSSLGSDVLSGGNAISPALINPNTAKQRAADQKALWDATDAQFGTLVSKLPDGSKYVADPGAKQQLGAIARYASAARTYTEYVPNENGHGYKAVTVTKGLDPKQAQLIDDLAKYGPNSDEFAASTIEFELDRKGGKPREDRMRKALLGEDILAAREGESVEAREKRLKGDGKNDPGDLKKAQDRKKAILAKVAERRAAEAPGNGGADAKQKAPAEVQAEILKQLDTRFEGDESGKKYTKSMIESDTLEPDPKAAFDFALAHKERNKETLDATLGRMNRKDIKEAVKQWNERPENEGKPLYKQLGLYGKGDGKLEGDDRNDIEMKFKGVPSNDLERAENAFFVTEQQKRDGTSTGRELASEDSKRMERNQAKILELMGVKREDMNEFGEIDIKSTDAQGNKIKAHFDKDTGELQIKNPKDRDAFETAVQMSHHHAESYKQAVDRVTQGIVMALVIAAAVITTFVTFGGAAAIWGPILITAAAGIAGMGVNAALRGDRYTKAEMERDLVMTFVQAATVGLGAWAGGAAKGAGAAAKAAASSSKVAGNLAGKTAAGGLTRGAKILQFGKTLGREAIVGGGTNALNSAAGAYMDPENRRKGLSWDKARDAGLKSFAGGSLGAIASKPFGALGRVPGRRLAFAGGALAKRSSVFGGRLGRPILGAGKKLSALGEDVIGNVGQGYVSRLAEARIGQSLGDPHQTLSESIESAKEGIAQDIIQSGGDHVGKARKESRARRQSAASAEAAHPASPSAALPPAPPHAADAAHVQTRVPAGPEPHMVAPALARTAEMHNALPPDVRPLVEAVIPEDHPVSKKSRREEEAARQKEAEAKPDNARLAGDGKLPGPGAKSDGDKPTSPESLPTPRKPEDSPDPHARLRSAIDDENGPATRREGSRDFSDEPTNPAIRIDHPEFPDGVNLKPGMLDDLPPILPDTPIRGTDPKDGALARQNYEIMRGRQPGHEVLLAFNPKSGEYMVVQGLPHSVTPPPEGWITVRHTHPEVMGGDQYSHFASILPSGFGGDFSVLRTEVERLSAARPGATVRRSSAIDITVNGKRVVTVFEITKQGDNYSLKVTLRPPQHGVQVLGPFKGNRDTAMREYAYAARDMTASGADFGLGHNKRSGPDLLTARAKADGHDAKLHSPAPGDKDMNHAQPKGPVFEPEAVTRLKQSLNNDSLTPAARRAIAEGAHQAARDHLIATGQLDPGEPLLMLFHGAPDARAKSLNEGGIELGKVKGGASDDFGKGLYFTSNLEAAMLYKGRSGEGGEVFPFFVRARDLGTVVDVSPAGKHRSAWDAFLDRSPAAYPPPPLDRHFATAREFVTGTGTVRMNEIQRGVAFDAFLKTLGPPHDAPDIVQGALGEPGLTGGIGKGDQQALKSTRLAGILNEQIGMSGRKPQDQGPRIDEGEIKLRSAVVDNKGEEKKAAPKKRGKSKAVGQLETDKVKEAPVSEPDAAEIATNEPADGKAKKQKKDRSQGKAALDPEKAAQKRAELEDAQVHQSRLEATATAAASRLRGIEIERAQLLNERPHSTLEAIALRNNLFRENDNHNDRIDALQDVLDSDVRLAPETRRFLEWQIQAWKFQRDLSAAESGEPQQAAREAAEKVRQAEDDSRKANRPIKKRMEQRGPNYRKKKQANTDEVMADPERFEARQAAAMAPPKGRSIPLSPDHLIPLDEIANMKELTPLLDIHRDRDTPSHMRDSIEKELRNLGDAPDNLVAMQSDANSHLKNAKSWHEVSYAAAETYGYTKHDVDRMRAREDKMREAIKAKIAELITKYKKELADKAEARRKELAPRRLEIVP